MLDQANGRTPTPPHARAHLLARPALLVLGVSCPPRCAHAPPCAPPSPLTRHPSRARPARPSPGVEGESCCLEIYPLPQLRPVFRIRGPRPPGSRRSPRCPGSPRRPPVVVLGYSWGLANVLRSVAMGLGLLIGLGLLLFWRLRSSGGGLAAAPSHSPPVLSLPKWWGFGEPLGYGIAACYRRGSGVWKVPRLGPWGPTS